MVRIVDVLLPQEANSTAQYIRHLLLSQACRPALHLQFVAPIIHYAVKLLNRRIPTFQL